MTGQQASAGAQPGADGAAGTAQSTGAAPHHRHHAKPKTPEHRAPVLVALACAMALWLFLPAPASFPPPWLLPLLTLLLLVPLVLLNPHHFNRETRWSRGVSIALAAVLAVFNLVDIVLTIGQLLNGKVAAPEVLLSALRVWLTMVVVFGLIFWELDRGGPIARRLPRDPDRVHDFRFPQEDSGPTKWLPSFVDYAYFSLSNMMAYSPTDVMPLTPRAKLLMAVQSFAGFVLLALVISRAVNILN